MFLHNLRQLVGRACFRRGRGTRFARLGFAIGDGVFDGRRSGRRGRVAQNAMALEVFQESLAYDGTFAREPGLGQGLDLCLHGFRDPDFNFLAFRSRHSGR